MGDALLLQDEEFLAIVQNLQSAACCTELCPAIRLKPVGEGAVPCAGIRAVLWGSVSVNLCALGHCASPGWGWEDPCLHLPLIPYQNKQHGNVFMQFLWHLPGEGSGGFNSSALHFILNFSKSSG